MHLDWPARNTEAASATAHSLKVAQMPKFEELKPEDVRLGRGRTAAEARKPYIEAIQASDAGKITLDRSDRASMVKARLGQASKETGIRIRSSWEDKQQRVLYWKRVGK